MAAFAPAHFLNMFSPQGLSIEQKVSLAPEQGTPADWCSVLYMVGSYRATFSLGVAAGVGVGLY
jgi:hypothetical protein